MELSADMQRVVLEQSLGFVATVTPEGTPNLSPKGTTTVFDAEHLMFADVASPGTVANLATNPNVEVNVVDPIVRKGYRFKGTATAYTSGEMFERGLAVLRERGSTTARERIRSIVVIEVTDAAPLFSPVYDDRRDGGIARGTLASASRRAASARGPRSRAHPWRRSWAVEQVMMVAEWFRDVLGFELDPARVFTLDPREGLRTRSSSVTGSRCTCNSGGSRARMFMRIRMRTTSIARVPDAAAFYAELVGRGAKVVQPLELQPYGMRDFSVESPEGHRVMFGSPVE